MTEPFTDRELDAIRAALPAVMDGPAYLNAGTLGPLPRAALEAMATEREYDERVRQSATHWDRLLELQQAARTAAARLTGAEPAQVALMHTTHEALNACLWGLDLRHGDSIVTTDEEHPGLLVPLRHLVHRTGCVVRTARWDEDAFVETVVAQVDASTRAVALSHVSWSSGRTAPLRDLRAALPADVRLVVDGAQSAGIAAVDPGDGWDAYTVSGQKWPCGPNGSGALVLRDPHSWLPTFGAYLQVTDHDDILRSPVVDDARRFEQSQEAFGPLAGFAASVGWLLDDVGLDRAMAHARHLNARARTGLTALGVDPAHLHGGAHLMSIDRPTGDAVAVATALLERGVLVRPLGETRVRASFGCWNTEAEVDLLVDAVAGPRGE